MSFTEAEKQEEKARRENTVGSIGMVCSPDGSQTRVRVVADYGPTLLVETLDETENFQLSVLTLNFAKQALEPVI